MSYWVCLILFKSHLHKLVPLFCHQNSLTKLTIEFIVYWCYKDLVTLSDWHCVLYKFIAFLVTATAITFVMPWSCNTWTIQAWQYNWCHGTLIFHWPDIFTVPTLVSEEILVEMIIQTQVFAGLWWGAAVIHLGDWSQNRTRVAPVPAGNAGQRPGSKGRTPAAG